LREPGLWRVAAVHLVPAPPRSSADWQSLWASLAFELLPRDAAKAPRRLEADEACRNRLPPAALSAGAMR
jgi:hypothetical protein